MVEAISVGATRAEVDDSDSRLARSRDHSKTSTCEPTRPIAIRTAAATRAKRGRPPIAGVVDSEPGTSDGARKGGGASSGRPRTAENTRR
jgi:hypothetical protein